MFADRSIKEFVDEIASSSPVPGGGGAAALVGAVGIALGDMVGELTTGKKKYADVEEDIRELMAEAQSIKDEFVRLVDADAEAFAPLAAAYRIPKDQPDRDEIMEKALKDAAAVPMDIMRACGRALDVIRDFAEKGSALAISDAGCAAACCKAAINAASLNVFINTKMMKDRAYADSLNEEADALLAEYNALADAVFDRVAGKLR
ncbi:MAG: cyclodeaminase/cyclohydrolase family protein [Clostridiales bacterium]|nr:cyclodeaminase/cyclohydrolase family protein [Clostridiales bacterium]